NASQPPPTAMKTWRNPVNSGYKSRAAPGMRNRAPYPDQGIYTPGRRSGDKRWRSRSPGINIEDAMPEATALRRDHEETALSAVQKNCRALFEQQSHRAAGDDIGARINISQIFRRLSKRCRGIVTIISSAAAVQI